jgi:DNA anti-recombination protein RmuC
MAGRENDIVWALEQASRYAKKYSEAVEETARLEEQLKALKESLDQAKKEIGYLAKLSSIQQQYIDKLEELTGTANEVKSKETTILKIHRGSIQEDAC